MVKLLSIITSVVIGFTTLMGVMPMETQAAAAKSASINNDISIEAANSFGNLLAEKLDPEIAEQTQSIGYNVFSAEVTGTEVTVEFETMSDCTLLAGIYDETREKLIATGTAEVLTGETEKTVTIETNEMPRYFYLKVYLIDETTMRPLCTAYESSLYTKEMQEFLAKTVNDFDSERVLNLDEDETNNFAVYGEDVAVVVSGEEVNAVTTADVENQKYVIENADSVITSLKTDDVVAIEPTNGEVLIIKVGEINIDGTTVTITGQDTDMEEVFDYVKIDISHNSSEAFCDDSYASEGVTPVNVSKNKLPDINGINNKKAIEEEVSGNLSNQYSIGVESNAASITGSVDLNAAVQLKLYLSLSEQFVEFTIENNHEVEIAFTGTISKEITITKFVFPLLPCLAIDVDIKFVLEASVSVSVKGVLTQTVGFSFDSNLGNPVKNLTTKPMLETSINVQGTVFVGISVSPSIVVFGEQFFEAGFESKSGVELSASLYVAGTSSNYSPEEMHECKKCLDGELSAKVTVGGFITLFNCDDLTFRIEHEVAKVPICDFYYSFDYNEFGLTTCPHIIKIPTSTTTDKNVIAQGICGENLTWVFVDDTLTIRGTGAMFDFPDSNHWGKWDVYTPHLKKVVITNGVTSIGNNVFGCCHELESITIPVTVKSIGDNAFRGCYNLKSITIPATVTSIGDRAFFECRILESITIPANVTSIGDDAFGACPKLTSIKVNMNNMCYSDDDGVLFSKDKTLLIKYPNDKNNNEYIIPDSVTSITAYAFDDCDNLTSISIPNSVTIIEKSAFTNCSALTSIDVDINNNNYSDINGVLFNKNKTLIIQYPLAKSNSKYVIPDSVTSIGDSAFAGSENLISITIPDGVTSIGDYAFGSGIRLTSVTIPDSVTSIGESAFKHCWKLTSITIPDGVTSIGDYTFYYCNSLTSVTIPDSVTSIGYEAFCYCNSLTSVTIPDSVTNISFNAFIRCEKLTTIIIPDGVKYIQPRTFSGCINLTSITLPDSVTSIEDNAFFNCEKLTSITIPDSVTCIGAQAFNGCDSLTSITIPDSVTDIGFYAFNCSTLNSITINNPECKISDQYTTICGRATIYGYADSTAEAYAKKYHRNFVAIDSESQALSLSNLKTSTNLKKSAVQKSDMTEVFTDLLPNEVYNFYVMKSRIAENPLSADNLLYITQAVSDENGGLTISYIPKAAYDEAEIFVAGITRKDISAAEITIPEIVFNGEEMIVTPDVIFEGETLVEGKDYNIESGYLVTAPGEYTITINGIGDYTNVKKVTYTVISGDNNSADTDIVYGDANCDGQVTMADAASVFMSIGNPDKYALSEKGALNADCNNNGDGVTVSDAIAIQKLVVGLVDKLPI